MRAWQMICVLSSFVCDDIVDEVTQQLHIALNVSDSCIFKFYSSCVTSNVKCLASTTAF